MSYGSTRIARSPSYTSGYSKYSYRASDMPTSSGYSSYSTSTASRSRSYKDYTPSSYSSSTSSYGTYGPHSTFTTTTRARPSSATRHRSPSRNRDRDYTSSTSTPIDSSGRPLPKGPGTRDRYGNLVDPKEHLSTLRSTLSRGSSLSRDVRGPMRADHSYGVSSPTSSVVSSVSPSRLTRSKRTNSVADITSKYEDMSLKSSRKYGSNADLSSSSRRSDDSTSYYSSSLPRKRSTSYNESSPLPDISINNRTSRSPSLDGRDSHGSRRDDDIISPSRDSYESSYRNKNSSLTDYSKSNGYSSSSADYNNNNKGLVGLRNIGNTCFMNSVLQCLSNTQPLTDFCLKERYMNDLNTRTSSMKGHLIKVFTAVMKALWQGDSDSITPSEFKNQIAKFAKRFVGYNQQDAQEFLIFLLEGLHEDINRIQEKKKRVVDDSDCVETISASEKAKLCWNNYLDHDNSKMVDLFVGQLRSALTCTVCDYTSNTFDPFWDLSLPLTKSHSSVSLRDCLDLFTQEEILDRDERPTCARCKKRQKCKKRFSIQRFPKVLIIHLKRFNQGSYYRSKLSTMVDFPISRLDLSDYAADNRDSSVSPIYNLYAVSNHSGSTGGGHYTAYAKNPHTSQWHYYNDNRVTTISESRVQSSEAYVLFYQLQGSSSRL